jgi:hypothetical protein
MSASHLQSHHQPGAAFLPQAHKIIDPYMELQRVIEGLPLAKYVYDVHALLVVMHACAGSRQCSQQVATALPGTRG